MKRTTHSTLSSTVIEFMERQAMLEGTFCDIKKQLLSKQIPCEYPSCVETELCISEERFDIISMSSFPLITKAWVNPLSAWIGGRKCIEIMGGSGMLSKAFQNCGVDVVCTDDYSWGSCCHSVAWGSYWADVIKMDAVEAVRTYCPDRNILICSWPSLDSYVAYKALLEMRRVNSNCLMLYIGEGYGGCTADNSFFEAAEFISDSEFRNATSKFQSWYGIRDSIDLIK